MLIVCGVAAEAAAAAIAAAMVAWVGDEHVPLADPTLKAAANVAELQSRSNAESPPETMMLRQIRVMSFLHHQYG